MKTTKRWLAAGLAWMLAGMVWAGEAEVRADSRPAVGRIHQLTGPVFAGNRLVLRAKASGNLSGAKYSWKRDGVEVARTERLDIASLKKSDFGTYTLTVTTSGGSATSEGFRVAETPAGVPAGWGTDYGGGQTETPAGLAGVVQVAAGYDFNLALRTNGTVAAWGNNSHGGCNVPAGLSGVSQVATAGGWSGGGGFAVKTDGRVVAWGRTYSVETYWDEWAHWEYDEETGDYTHWADWVTYTNGTDLIGTIPQGLANVVKVVAGENTALALTADGNVVAWGREYSLPDMPEEVADVVDIALSYNVVFALRADGTVVAWGYGWNGETDIPPDLADAVAVAAPQYGAGFALQADGTLRAWGDQYDYYGLLNVPQSGAGFVQLAAGTSYGAALDAAGRVAVWGQTWSVGNIPGWIQGEAQGIAAGAYHCMALVADTDGDTIPDGLESRYGRDPSVWEPWERVSVGGTVTVDGLAATGRVAFVLLDATGQAAGRGESDGSGTWRIDGVVPGAYTLQVAADGAVDPETVAVSTLGGAVAGLDFHLDPGEGRAMAKVEAHLAGNGERFDEADCSVVELPKGTAVYLDMWPAELGRDGLLDLGEVGACRSTLDGTVLMPHLVTAKRPESGAQVPVPAPAGGREGATVAASPHFSSGSGSVRIATDPAGAEVWVDYADQSLGVTPLTVGNLSAAASHAHILLLKKDGYLRPRPVEFRVEAGLQTEISVPLTGDAAAGRTAGRDASGQCAGGAAAESVSAARAMQKVTFDPNGGSCKTGWEEYTIGGTYTPLPTASREGYEFAGWFTSAKGGVQVKASDTVTSESARTVYAHWKGGTPEPENAIVVSSAIPGMDIYVDYLPTGQVTPATVGGMDPASHAGVLWHSASHSILLRHAKMRPFAPRAVPDGSVLDEASGEWISVLDGELAITAPNTYDDSDGDGVRNDKETAGGGNPFDPAGNAAIQTPVPVPYTWLDLHPKMMAAAGNNREKAAAADYDGDGRTAWEEYVAGTDPEDGNDVFRVTELKQEGGEWIVECAPKDERTRGYNVESAEAADGTYGASGDSDGGTGRRFFRVGVWLR